jgi:hypothetical protein
MFLDLAGAFFQIIPSTRPNNFGSTVYNGKNTASIPPKTEEP